VDSTEVSVQTGVAIAAKTTYEINVRVKQSKMSGKPVSMEEDDDTFDIVD
jgi:hypothetical protein